ncbi:MFS transporter [Cohnella sp. CFH 77786]|uniref:MFS transporter n=1 Tax=Cohnella sp. CFH 77786 TaxID=2662265 RepID=UPI001C609955
MALTGLSAVFLFEMLDNSILNVALPTIGQDLHASTITLQWVTNAYAVVFGGLMLLFGAIADRFGRRRIMLVGLVLLGIASLATAFVFTSGELIAVRVAMGGAAAMTTPGSMALAFRLFEEDSLRVRATTLISTVGLVGLAIGPVVGGFMLAIAPWQALLLVNVPISVLAIVGVRFGIAEDDAEELHRDPVDFLGAVLSTVTIVLALLAPTLFVNKGAASWISWAAIAATVAGAILFFIRESLARYPLLDLKIFARPLVSSGLAYKASSGLAIAGLGYMVTLQLQLDWGWSPGLAAIGMLPQVIVLVAAGPFINPIVHKVGLGRAAWLGTGAVVFGLAIYSLLSSFGYVWVAISLVIVAAGMRVVGVVAAINVFRGLPKNRTSIGAALIDTSSQITTAVGISVVGTVLAVLFNGDIAKANWSTQQVAQFREAVTIAGLSLTAVSAVLVVWAMVCSRGVVNAKESTSDP